MTRNSTPYLLDFVQPLFVGLELGHERLVLQPLAVQVSGLVVRQVLSCEHLLTDPQGQLCRQTQTDRLYLSAPYHRLACGYSDIKP